MINRSRIRLLIRTRQRGVKMPIWRGVGRAKDDKDGNLSAAGMRYSLS